MTGLLFRDDAYLTTAPARIVSLDANGIVLDQTPFYPQGGGQPGDTGLLRASDGVAVPVTDTVYAPDRRTVLHRIDPVALDRLQPDDTVIAELDWAKRWSRMRIHTALHLLTTVLAFPVTGGSIGNGEGRLDFDMPAGGDDRETIEMKLNALIRQDYPVTSQWITDDELIANPGLVKTMSVKPPMGSGRVRLVRIGDIDLQPCGGTHVAATAEIGRVAVVGIEKKGKQNRRVRIVLADLDRT